MKLIMVLLAGAIGYVYMSSSGLIDKDTASSMLEMAKNAPTNAESISSAIKGLVPSSSSLPDPVVQATTPAVSAVQSQVETQAPRPAAITMERPTGCGQPDSVGNLRYCF